MWCLRRGEQMCMVVLICTAFRALSEVAQCPERELIWSAYFWTGPWSEWCFSILCRSCFVMSSIGRPAACSTRTVAFTCWRYGTACAPETLMATIALRQSRRAHTNLEAEMIRV